MALPRRSFLRATVATAAAAQPLTQAVAQSTTQKKMIGIQVGAVSFLDEGVDKVLDIFQSKAYVNTLFVATFTYGRGIAGRQVPGQPLPDHGKQEYDLNFRGGCFTKLRPEFYKDTVLKDVRSRDHGEYDVLEAVLPAARKRGMKTICWYEDVWRNDVPNFDKVTEVDFRGRRTSRTCMNNPDHRAFIAGIAEDWTRNYEVDGIMWGSERHGALGTALGSSHGGKGSDPGRAGCFCEHCLRKARERGISADRAKQGFQVLEQYVRAARGGKRPVDGHFVEFLRITMRYPEIFAWEQLWHDSLRECYDLIYRRVKSAKPSVQVGWHIWHTNSFSPFYRAQQDMQELSKYSDFLKMVIYHNCGGERMATYIDSVQQHVYGDMNKDEALAFNYKVLNFAERSYEQIPYTGLSSDYVYRDAKRCMDGAAGTKTQIWPGIDIDIPTGLSNSRSTPPGTKGAVTAALKAGAHGVLLSRKYSEMKLANLAAAGEAVREMGLA
ncbi:MAG: hypothetical protein JNL98_23105 [Bryobacterales bacterium]|nr:hypothetical protein [Bryobacterales bacterium]